MYVLGLTGSIAMGKSWGAKCFRLNGVPVHDADACVHRLLSPGGAAVDQVAEIFPGVLDAHGGVDRRALSDQVFNDGRALALLEYILHPMVRLDQHRFLARNARAGRSLVVLDIPLLFETAAQKRVDAVVVMSTSHEVQAQRALRRPGMTLEKFYAILAHQTPDAIKRLGAEFLVLTGGPKGQSLRRVAEVVKVSKRRTGKVWGPGWAR